SGHDVTAAPGGGQVEMQLPALPRLVHLLELRELVLAGAHLGGLLLGAVDEEAPLRLVVVAGPFAGCPHPLFRPGALRAHPPGQPALLVDIVPVRLLLLAAGQGPSLDVLAPPACVLLGPMA